jgi:transposase
MGTFDLDDERHKLFAFVTVLSFSRMRFVTFTTSLDISTFVKCHVLATRATDRASRKRKKGGAKPRIG